MLGLLTLVGIGCFIGALQASDDKARGWWRAFLVCLVLWGIVVLTDGEEAECHDPRTAYVCEGG